MKRILAIFGGILLVAMIVGGITGKPINPPISSNWRLVGERGIFRFVEITPGQERNRAAYDEAVSALCGQPSSPSICVLNFYAQGDKIPPSGDTEKFNRDGGFENYPDLATYWGNRNTASYEYTKWDCERAGIEGAPLSALCGSGVKETYDAALDLGGYKNFATGCGLPVIDDSKNFQTFLSKIQNPKQRDFYRQAFDQMLTGHGPDDPAICVKLRAKIEKSAQAARKTLGFP